MVGYGNNKGIVPIFCEELFKGVEDKKATAGENEEYQVWIFILIPLSHLFNFIFVTPNKHFVVFWVDHT